MLCRNTGGNNTIINSNSEVIPNGFGKGNVVMQGFTPGSIIWNLNGFSETINGLSSIGASVAAGVNITTNIYIQNSVINTTSTLTIGDNDQSAVFGGVIGYSTTTSVGAITNGVGIVAVTKIGAGVETFTNVNSYIGNTTVSNGILQLTGIGKIPSSTNINIFGGALDVSQESGYAFGSGQTVNVSGGTLLASVASSGGAVNFTNGTLQIASLNGGGDGSGTANLTASAVNIDASGGFVKVLNTPKFSSFPDAYPVMHYTTLGGSGTLTPILPSGLGGYIVNSNAFSTFYLVVTNGPLTPVITWKGLNGATVDGDWDFQTPDWVSNTTPVDYSDGAIVRFTDTASTSQINITTLFTSGIGPVPGGVIVSNNAATYTFGGPGAIGGTNGLTKLGSGTLILDNTGGDNYSGGMNISGGTVQLGKNDTGGSLGGGSVAVGGTLVFNRANSDLIVTNPISGSGVVHELANAYGNILALQGANSSFSGTMNVDPGAILQAGNIGALGSATATNNISNGASLDINAQNLGASGTVTVQGVGVTNISDGSTNGAIYNSGGSIVQALSHVTLLGDTVFGAPENQSANSNRWDLRSTTITDANGASLSTGGHAYNLTKVGANQVGIVGVTVDPALGNIDIQGGILSIEQATTGLGNPASTVTVEPGASLQFYQMTNQMNKNIVVQNNGGIISANGNNTVVGPMSLNGSDNFKVNAGGSLTLSNVISGSGTLNYNGTNTLILAGVDGHTGGTVVNAGTLIFNTTSANALTEAQGATIGGNGTNNGTVFLDGGLFPGVGGKPSTFGSGPLTVDANGAPIVEFSLGATNTPGAGVNDLINVSGSLDGQFNPITINPVGPMQNVTYTLINYSGSLVSPFSGVSQTVATRYNYVLLQGSGKIQVAVSGATTLEWNNASGDGLWNVQPNSSANWSNTTSLASSDVFYQLDAVLLDDSIISSGATNVIAIMTNSASSSTNNFVIPSVLINNSTTNYVINGPGKISGAASIVKMGTSTLTINSANDFTGTTTISGGTVLMNTTNALGGPNNAVYVTNNGTLDIGGPSFVANQGNAANTAPILGQKPVYISGPGINSSNGCIINSSANVQEYSIQQVTMTGDAAIGCNGVINGAGRFDIGRLTPNSFSTGGHAYNLTKVGTNQVSLVNLAVDPALGNIDIQGGELGFETGTTFGDPTHTLTVESGATIEFFETTNSLNKPLIVNGGALAQGTEPNIWFNGGGIPNNSINSLVTITNGTVVVGGGASGTISNAISGPGSLRIAGSVYLDATNTYTGFTGVSNNGTLFLVGTASIGQSTNITLEGTGAKIDVSGRANGTLTLAGQKLRGFGTINGTLTNNADGTVSPGTNSVIGTLTVTTNATLNGTTVMKLDAGNLTNDVLSVGNVVNYGGTLNVTNISATALAAGQSYKVFNALTYNGSFTITPSTPGAGLVWDTSSLATSGTLKVTTSGPPPQAHITGITLNGTTLTLTGTNGGASAPYVLLESTNIALPLSLWATGASGTFGADGSLSLSTNILNSTNAQQFFILKQ